MMCHHVVHYIGSSSAGAPQPERHTRLQCLLLHGLLVVEHRSMQRTPSDSAAEGAAALGGITAGTHIHAETARLANIEGIPAPKSMKARRQLFSQRWAQCIAKERAGAGGRSPGLHTSTSSVERVVQQLASGNVATQSVLHCQCCTDGSVDMQQGRRGYFGVQRSGSITSRWWHVAGDLHYLRFAP
eukprot:GHUV01044126.1.p1 GENE.GHUV01044126.1~~GHUV01044126.1.p1  ORF type:complete len:186 (+),score=29.98 GHUV01044126.1:86-643(+)